MQSEAELEAEVNTTMVVERQKLYSQEPQQRRPIEDCAGPPLHPDLRLCLPHSPRQTHRKSDLMPLIGGLCGDHLLWRELSETGVNDDRCPASKLSK